MNGWFHYAKLFVALTGCIGFMMIKYKWGIDAKHWFKPFPFVIAAFCYILHVAKKRHINPYKEDVFVNQKYYKDAIARADND